MEVGEAAQSAIRMSKEAISNLSRLESGRAPEYDSAAKFVMWIVPSFERETEAQIKARISKNLRLDRKRDHLYRDKLPEGAPGLFLLQANLLLRAIEGFPRVVSMNPIGEIDQGSDGKAVLYPMEGIRDDPQRSEYVIAQRIGSTMSRTYLAAFACELIMKSIRLAQEDKVRKSHDLSELFDDLPEGSRRRILAAYPEIESVLGKSKKTFGDWRYFDRQLGKSSIQTVDQGHALLVEKAARVLVDEALYSGVSGAVEVKGTETVSRTGAERVAGFDLKFTMKGGEKGVFVNARQR